MKEETLAHCYVDIVLLSKANSFISPYIFLFLSGLNPLFLGLKFEQDLEHFR